jgi:hypothetical protein
MGQETVADSTKVDLNKKELIRVLLFDDRLGVLQITKECLKIKGLFQAKAISLVEPALDSIKAALGRAIITMPKMNPNGRENHNIVPASTRRRIQCV